jgi:hypothetical protein
MHAIETATRLRRVPLLPSGRGHCGAESDRNSGRPTSTPCQTLSNSSELAHHRFMMFGARYALGRVTSVSTPAHPSNLPSGYLRQRTDPSDATPPVCPSGQNPPAYRSTGVRLQSKCSQPPAPGKSRRLVIPRLPPASGLPLVLSAFGRPRDARTLLTSHHLHHVGETESVLPSQGHWKRTPRSRVDIAYLRQFAERSSSGTFVAQN